MFGAKDANTISFAAKHEKNAAAAAAAADNIVLDKRAGCRTTLPKYFMSAADRSYGLTCPSNYRKKSLSGDECAVDPPARRCFYFVVLPPSLALRQKLRQSYWY